MRLRRFLFPLISLLLLIGGAGCDDEYSTYHSFTKEVTQSKSYPVYLDMGKVGAIAVKSTSPLVSPFKIVSNPSHFFVGDSLGGIHVYQKDAHGTTKLCYIECPYLRDFDVIGNRLFCNNLTDMVVLDVSNPPTISLLHREPYYFNQFSDYKTYWNFPFQKGKGIQVNWETRTLTGTITDRQPQLDFSEVDAQCAHLTTTEIPDGWLENNYPRGKPYSALVNVANEEIYSLGTYNSWKVCSYSKGEFLTKDIKDAPYPSPYYYSNSIPVKLSYKENIIYILERNEANHSSGHVDCLLSTGYFRGFHLYFPNCVPKDATYVPELKAFYILAGHYIWAAFTEIKEIPAFVAEEEYRKYPQLTDASSINYIDKKIITVGRNGLSIYLPGKEQLEHVREYPDISGRCFLFEENRLVTADLQGLKLYNTSDLNNIQQIQ